MEGKESTRAIPQTLLAEAMQAASDDDISVNELVRDAMDQRSRIRRREHLLAYGAQQARKLGSEKKV